MSVQVIEQRARVLPPFLRIFYRALVGDGCWEWQGLRRATGHGRVMLDGRRLPAHQAAYELWHGTTVPSGMQVNHHCDNPPCLRPDHLYLGDQRENVADRDRRRRHAAHAQTHCRNGHPFDETNTAVQRRQQGTPFRRCRMCAKAATARYRRKKSG